MSVTIRGSGQTVLQVVSATTTTNTSSSSTTFVDAAGLAVNITPFSSTSKFLVICDINTYVQSDNSTTGGLQIVRNGTAVYLDNSVIRSNTNANVGVQAHTSFMYLDSPATASAITYKVQIKQNSTAGTNYAVQVNLNAPNNISSITVLEISGS